MMFLDNVANTVTGTGNGAANALCSNIASFESGSTEAIFNLIGKIVQIFQIAIPILLVVIGLITLGKAVVAGKDDEVKKATSSLVKKLVLAAAIFFVVAIVKLVIGLVSGGAANNNCWQLVTSPRWDV